MVPVTVIGAEVLYICCGAANVLAAGMGMGMGIALSVSSLECISTAEVPALGAIRIEGMVSYAHVSPIHMVTNLISVVYLPIYPNPYIHIHVPGFLSLSDLSRVSFSAISDFLPLVTSWCKVLRGFFVAWI